MILVTTPNGKVGSEVAARLLAVEVPIRVGAHSVAKAQQAFPQAQVVPFDFADAATVRAALNDVETMYLASPGPMLASPVNQVVDLAKAAGVRHIVRLSAMGVEQGTSPLREIEQHIEASGLAWTFLRPSWFMQNYSTINAESIRQGGTFSEPAGDAATAFIDARDIAAVAVKALTETGHTGQAYSLTGSRAYNRTEVAHAIAAAIGKDVRYVPVSAEQFRETLALYNTQGTYIELMDALYQMVRAGWTETVTDTVAQILGRQPISLEEFAVDHRNTWM